MAFANSDITDIIATTIENRSGVVADNVTDNNALLRRLKTKGKVKPFSGGQYIMQELSFQDNSTAMYYSGGEVLNISAQDVISGSRWDIKQAAVAVTITGLEELQNSGEEAFIDLLDARMDVAEASIMNLVASGIYSDGTGTGGKQITGLQAIIADAPATGIVGGINRGTWSFWRNQTYDATSTGGASTSSSNIQSYWNTLYASCTRGNDVPDLITVDNTYWGLFLGSLQTNQRFAASADMAAAGFVSMKYINSDVVLDGGIGGNVPSKHAYFINTNYIFYRPHRKRNFAPIGGERFSTNQDAIVRLMGWAGNMSASGCQFSGVFFE
jgi:hypothetical protein